VRVVIVQHGEKEPVPGDPGLTALGREQARAAARWIAAGDRPTAVWSSPLRRAVETAGILGQELGVETHRDDRLRERMNWEGDGTLEEFLEDWRRASTDRGYVPAHGDSSRAAADRFLAALDDIAAAAPGTTVVVGHGGVTTDALRTLLGDEQLLRRAPGVIDGGIPGGRITVLERGATGAWVAGAIARQVDGLR
jgi:broad specificity phosphatase PhoE